MPNLSNQPTGRPMGYPIIEEIPLPIALQDIIPAQEEV
jgi:hypothetical protein